MNTSSLVLTLVLIAVFYFTLGWAPALGAAVGGIIGMLIIEGSR